MAEATARPPLCYASIANQAQGLVLHGRRLTVNHNNASVELSMAADGTGLATLYAVVRIKAGIEIMWSYGDNFNAGFELQSPDDEEGERDTSVVRNA